MAARTLAGIPRSRDSHSGDVLDRAGMVSGRVCGGPESIGVLSAKQPSVARSPGHSTSAASRHVRSTSQWLAPRASPR